MNKKLRYKLLLIAVLAGFSCDFSYGSSQKPEEPLRVRKFILDHTSDKYEWHITTIHSKPISIPLPVILYSTSSGWHFFMSSQLNPNQPYKGFFISQSPAFEGKIVELNATGSEIRPVDISITKNAFSLLISSALLIVLILFVARSYKQKSFRNPSSFVIFFELIIVNLTDELIKPCIGKDYKRFTPYLLTLFFFIFINNILGLIPLFPGGANVMGNIAVTLVLGLLTFIIVNVSGTRAYWREIFWPDVPVWLKIPIPIMPVIELVGIFTKPFALIIRLFANMLAGHAIVLGLTTLVFISVSLGPVLNSGITVLSVTFSVFVLIIELLVTYIQAYVFTLLSAIFIGLARTESHAKHHIQP